MKTLINFVLPCCLRDSRIQCEDLPASQRPRSWYCFPPEEVAGNLMFTETGGICDTWAGCIQMLFGVLNVGSEADALEIASIFHRKAEANKLPGRALTMKATGIDFRPPPAHSRKSIVAVNIEPSTDEDMETLEALKEWIRDLYKTIESSIMYKRQIEERAITHITIRKFDSVDKSRVAPAAREQLVFDGLMFGEFRMEVCSQASYQEDPRFPNAPILSRRMLKDSEGRPCRYVFAACDFAPQILMIPPEKRDPIATQEADEQDVEWTVESSEDMKTSPGSSGARNKGWPSTRKNQFGGRGSPVTADERTTAAPPAEGRPRVRSAFQMLLQETMTPQSAKVTDDDKTTRTATVTDENEASNGQQPKKDS